MEKVSVIVAAYNVEKYIEECIISIEKQTYKDIEIVLIDDGSKDTTCDICDRLEKEYHNVIVRHIENRGVSKARNIAIEIASGKYIFFVDGDDCIEENMIALMMEKIKKENADLCICNYYNYYKGIKEIAKFNTKTELDRDQSRRELFKNDSIRGFTCNKVFKSKIIKDNLICFNENISMCEDLLFCFNYIQYIKKVVTINIPLYNYRMRKSSALNADNKKNISVFEAFNEMERIDPNIYKYNKDFYTYLFFKYNKEIKENNIKVKRISLVKCLADAEISLKTKLYSVLFIILPRNIQAKIKEAKKNKLQYFE